ncbi:MAG: diaminopimelate epimerase [Cytophagales bacterium]|nr:diaminopimelate epimerase [Armatimonadota bacterium]
MQFTKMQGIGNDFVVADCLIGGALSEDTLQSASKFLCDRKFGIGGDGVLLVLPSNGADYKMRMFNPDGTEAEMCGNGIRCFAKFVYDRGYTNKTVITVETLGGVKSLALRVQDGAVDQVKVDMGAPGLERADLPMTGEAGTALAQPVKVTGASVLVTGVSIGNPHIVYYRSPATDESVNHLGPLLEKHPLFPRRTNVHEVEVLSRREIKMLTWERGAGRTLACGTGACACVVASVLNDLTDRSVMAHLPGGDLLIEWSEEDNHVYMTGTATEVFTGAISLPS